MDKTKGQRAQRCPWYDILWVVPPLRGPPVSFLSAAILEYGTRDGAHPIDTHWQIPP